MDLLSGAHLLDALGASYAALYAQTNQVFKLMDDMEKVYRNLGRGGLFAMLYGADYATTALLLVSYATSENFAMLGRVTAAMPETTTEMLRAFLSVNEDMKAHVLDTVNKVRRHGDAQITRLFETIVDSTGLIGGFASDKVVVTEASAIEELVIHRARCMRLRESVDASSSKLDPEKIAEMRLSLSRVIRMRQCIHMARLVHSIPDGPQITKVKSYSYVSTRDASTDLEMLANARGNDAEPHRFFLYRPLSRTDIYTGNRFNVYKTVAGELSDAYDIANIYLADLDDGNNPASLVHAEKLATTWANTPALPAFSRAEAADIVGSDLTTDFAIVRLLAHAIGVPIDELQMFRMTTVRGNVAIPSRTIPLQLMDVDEDDRIMCARVARDWEEDVKEQEALDMAADLQQRAEEARERLERAQQRLRDPQLRQYYPRFRARYEQRRLARTRRLRRALEALRRQSEQRDEADRTADRTADIYDSSSSDEATFIF